MKVLPPVLTVEQLAEFLGQDRHDLYKAIRTGNVPGAHRAGKRWYIGRDNYLKAVTKAPCETGAPAANRNRTVEPDTEDDFDLGSLC